MRRPNANGRVRTAVRRLGARRVVDRTFDWVRYEIDALTDPVYLPDDHLPPHPRPSVRATGTRTRWGLLQPVLHAADVRSALDLGCNSGWFVVELGRLGIATLGIENHPAYHRSAVYSVERSGLENVGVAKLSINEQTLALLPRVDCVLFLSLWHHLVHESGMDEATRTLEAAWNVSKKVLVFETVSRNAAASFDVPDLSPDDETWFRTYFARVCPDADVVPLGTSAVAAQEQSDEDARTLFALLRRDRANRTLPQLTADKHLEHVRY
jgi:SAM-dependent methyltransferase